MIFFSPGFGFFQCPDMLFVVEGEAAVFLQKGPVVVAGELMAAG